MYQSRSSHNFRAANAHRIRWTRICIVVLCSVSLGWLAETAWAQNYKSLCSRAMNRAQEQKLFRTVGPAIRNPSGFGAAEEDVKNYMRSYFMKMTCTKPEDLGELGESREKLFKQFILATKNQAAQETLTELSFSAASAFAQDNYHPAVRYNATLILGNLDSKYATLNQPPVPLPAATEVLMDLVEKDSIDAKDGKSVEVHPSVKTGALVGLERHARFGVDPRHTQRLTKVLTDFVAKQERHEEVSEEVDHWMKCQAVAALVQLLKAQPTQEMQLVLLKTMSDKGFSLDDRCYIANLMKDAKYENAQGIDGSATLISLARLSQDVMQNEAKLAKDFQRERLAGGGDFRPGARLFGGGRGQEDLVHYEIRRLLSRLRAIERGGSSVANGVSEEYKAKISELLDLMQPIRAKAAEKDPSELAIAKLVLDAQPELDQFANSLTPDGPAAQPADANDDFAVR